MAKKKKKNVEKNIEEKVVEKKKEEKKETKSNNKDKRSLWVRFRIFCHGVRTEFEKIHWPSKYDLVKYSLAVIMFVVILSLFFHIITTIFNLLLKVLA